MSQRFFTVGLLRAFKKLMCSLYWPEGKLHLKLFDHCPIGSKKNVFWKMLADRCQSTSNKALRVWALG